MRDQKQGAYRFFQDWIPEFTRAVEMFSGEQPSITYEMLDAAGLGRYWPRSGEIWWKQVLEAGESGAVWIGADQESWQKLGDGARETYLEMLGQSLEGAAHVLSSGLTTRVICHPGEVQATFSPTDVETGRVQIEFAGQPPFSLIVALENGLANALNLSKSVSALAKAVESVDTPSLSDPVASPTREQEHAPDFMNRLINLDLPMSVVLGRAVLPIREVLRMTAGSLIELDHHVGDNVDLLIHGTIVARGQVVSVKGNYAVRIQTIISEQDRVALHNKERRQARVASPVNH